MRIGYENRLWLGFAGSYTSDCRLHPLASSWAMIRSRVFIL